MINHRFLYKERGSVLILARTSSTDKWGAALVILAIALFSRSWFSLFRILPQTASWYQGFRTPFLAFDRNDTGLHRLGFGDTMEKGLVATIGKCEKPIQGQLGNRIHAYVEVVEAMDAAQNLVNGGVCAPGLLWLEGEDSGLWSTQPGDEGCKLCNIDLCPIELCVTQVLPEELQVMGTGRSCWTAVQVMKEFEVGEDRLDGPVAVIEYQVSDSLRLGETHPLHFDHRRPFRLEMEHRYHSTMSNRRCQTQVLYVMEQVQLDYSITNGKQGEEYVLYVASISC